jgi:hypothetical protein
MEDLVTLGASAKSLVPGAEGLSGITACREGAAKTSGSSSSLQARNRFQTTQKRKEVKNK